MLSKVTMCPHVGAFWFFLCFFVDGVCSLTSSWHSISWADEGEVKMNLKAYGEGVVTKTLAMMAVKHAP